MLENLSTDSILTHGLLDQGLGLESVLAQGFPQEARPPLALSSTAIPLADAANPAVPKPGSPVGRVAPVRNSPTILDINGDPIYSPSLPTRSPRPSLNTKPSRATRGPVPIK